MKTRAVTVITQINVIKQGQQTGIPDDFQSLFFFFFQGLHQYLIRSVMYCGAETSCASLKKSVKNQATYQRRGTQGQPAY